MLELCRLLKVCGMRLDMTLDMLLGTPFSGDPWQMVHNLGFAIEGHDHSGMSHLKDPSVPELRTMIDMAFASPYPMVRYFGAQLSKSAWSKGQTQYDQVLGDYMRTETNTWLLDQAAKFRAPMKAGKAKP